MRRWLVGIALVLSATGSALPAVAGNGTSTDRSGKPVDLAVIGDSPYSAAAEAAFPRLVDQINADPKVRDVVHIGDIKSGSSVCSEEYDRRILALFNTLKDPVMYTPGDNEWTDCHRPAAGGLNPVDQLAVVRDVFFAGHEGQTLGGRPKAVASQTGYPENVRWMESRVVFAALNIPGSNDDRVPWFGVNETDAQKTQQADEVDRRQHANLDWLRAAFAAAHDENAQGVVIFIQADMWDPATPADQLTGYAQYKDLLAQVGGEFAKPVLLINGDSHSYRVDPGRLVANLTQVTIQKSDVDGGGHATEWLRLHIDPQSSPLFSWERVQHELP
jgi:hypothetical protein